MTKRLWLIAGAAALAAAVAAAALLAGRSQASLELDPERVAQGRHIYAQYCASCHGSAGEGMPDWERPNAQGELPAPPHGPQGHTWKHSDAMLYRMISEGWRDPWNKTERLSMPAFGDVLSPQEIIAVITYLKTLWTLEQRQFQKHESEAAPFPAETD